VSWEQLRDILTEAAQIEQEQKTQRPVACPLCGEPLITSAGGELSSCRFDGWTSDQLG